MLSHRALLANHEQLADDRAAAGRAPTTCVLLALPLFHAYGLNTGLGAVAYHGACGRARRALRPGRTPLRRHRAARRHRLVGVPPMFLAWSLMADAAHAAWRAVRLAVCGAAPLDAAAARRFAEATGQPVHQGYGLTETAPVLTSTAGRRHGRSPARSAGRSRASS